jgi:hypothetical protein
MFIATETESSITTKVNDKAVVDTLVDVDVTEVHSRHDKKTGYNVLCAQCGEIVDYGDATCAGDEAEHTQNNVSTRYHICDDCMDDESPDSYDYEEESIEYGVKEL